MNNSVFLDYIESYDIDAIQSAVSEALDILKIRGEFKPKMKILVKVCLPNSNSPDNAQTTHPAVVTAVVNELTKMGATCVVADSPYRKYSPTALDEVYLNTGMLEVANLTPCELNHDLRVCKIETPDGKKAKSLTLLELVNGVDAIVNIGKIKIDTTFGYFGATHNMFGLVPGELKSLVMNRLINLGNFNHYIIDILEAMKDKLLLNVLDGVVALEAVDTPRMLSCIGLSCDPYALDASILDILGVGYNSTILKQASERKVFNKENPYKLVGEKIEKFKVEDFALSEFGADTLLNKSNGDRNRYFNANQRRVKIDGKICKGCGVCSKICPTGAIMMKYDKEGELYAEVDYDKCIFCFKCHTACPYKVVDIISPLGYKHLEKELNKYNEE